LELRYPERRIEAGDDAAFIGWWTGLMRNAPSDAAFAEAMQTAFKPFLRFVFAQYLSVADELDDAPTVRILRHAVLDLDEQVNRLRAARTTGRWQAERPPIAPATAGGRG